ncbi:MAG: PASTA domain-containing protein [Endomicrobiia bacterium]
MTEPKSVPRGLSIMIVVLISLIVSFGMTFITYFYLFPSIERKHFVVKTPDVRKISLTEAIAKLSSEGLNYNVIDEVEDEELIAGTVIYQLPLPKTNTRRGTEVALMVSKGVPTVYVPKLKNKTLDEAREILFQLGFSIGQIKEIESEEVKQAGIVLDSYPPEGSSVKKGSIIELVVSQVATKKTEMVLVPNIVGKTLVEGQKILQSKGLRLGNVRKITNENFEFDMILEQNPVAGKKVPAGSGVNITLNTEAE